jgi:outer membrane protein TolC
MIGANQTFPASRTLKARAAVADADAGVAALGEATRRRELVAQIRQAFAEYYRTDRQLRLHQEHVALTQELIELGRSAYRSGTSGQQDLLRLGLELSRIHGQLAHMEPERVAAAALLNALMNRPLEAPLGPPAELTTGSAGTAPPSDLARTEIAVAKKNIERSEAAVSLAKANASLPSLMLGADYMYMPMNAHMHGYTAMVGLNLPWISPGRTDEVRAAEQTLIAERRAFESTQTTVRYEILQARTQYEAAAASYEVLNRDVMIQAERNLEAARASYAGGQGGSLNLLDALRSYLEVRIDKVRALVHLESARAELDRVCGQEGLR